jgi:hypothetical protein
VRVWDITSSTEILCYDTAYSEKFEFSDDGTKIVVNGNSMSIPLQIPLPSTTAESPKHDPHLPVHNFEVNGDWVTLSSERILWLPPEYRPGRWVSQGDTIVIGSRTGRITFVHYVATGFSSS